MSWIERFQKLNKTIGRPKSKIKVNFNHRSDALEDVAKLCNNELMKEKVKNFAEDMKGIVTKSVTIRTQTNCDIKTVLDFASFEKGFLMLNLWSEIKSEDQVKTLFLLHNDPNFPQQCDVFSFLGNSLNEDI